jgi:hypothetical protein
MLRRAPAIGGTPRFPRSKGKENLAGCALLGSLRLASERFQRPDRRITAPRSRNLCSIGMGTCATAFKPDHHRDFGCARADRVGVGERDGLPH